MILDDCFNECLKRICWINKVDSLRTQKLRSKQGVYKPENPIENQEILLDLEKLEHFVETCWKSGSFPKTIDKLRKMYTFTGNCLLQAARNVSYFFYANLKFALKQCQESLWKSGN